jgi:hypothetical protein
MTLFSNSLFLEFQLPNAPTWFYLSLLLGVGLFFKFNRFLSIRNWDTITLFLLVPGLVLLFQAREAGYAYLEWYGYLWLLCGSGYFLVRCLVDLALVRRPHLNSNLNFAGLAWLACALFICLGSVAFRQDRQPAEPVGKVGFMPDEIERRTTEMVQQQTPVADADGIDVGFWVGRSLAILCHLAVVAGLIFIGCRHFQDAHTGMAAATFYLLLPYTAYHIGQWHHVLPMALIVWGVGLYRRPMLAGLLLGLAAGTVYFPVLIFPLWLSFYWRRGAGRFAGTFVLAASVCMAIMGSILLSDGDLGRNLQSVLSLADWQPWIEPGRESPSFWTGVHWAWAYRMPVFIAYLAFLATTVFWPHPKNLAHVLALSAALLVGIQFWYAEQGGVYVLWYLPLLLLLVFRPNLSDRQPPAINPETDWLCRLGRWLVRKVTRLLVPMEPVKVGR